MPRAGADRLRVLRVLGARAIEAAVSKKRHLSAKVSCPSPVLQQDGLVFNCLATTKKGTGTFRVTEIDGSGHVKFVGV